MGNRDDVAALVFVDIVRGENVSWDSVGNEYADDYGNRRDDFEEYHRDLDRQLTGLLGKPAGVSKEDYLGAPLVVTVAHQHEAGGDGDDADDGEGIPEDFAGSVFRFSFRQDVAQREPSRQASHVSRVVDSRH